MLGNVEDAKLGCHLQRKGEESQKKEEKSAKMRSCLGLRLSRSHRALFPSS
jgi:hypothetical protein